MTTEKERKQARERQRKRRKKEAEKKKLEEAFLLMDWNATMEVPGNPGKWYRFLVCRGYMPPVNDWQKLAAGMASFIEETINDAEAETSMRWSMGLFKKRAAEKGEADKQLESDPYKLFSSEEMEAVNVRKGP